MLERTRRLPRKEKGRGRTPSTAKPQRALKKNWCGLVVRLNPEFETKHLNELTPNQREQVFELLKRAALGMPKEYYKIPGIGILTLLKDGRPIGAIEFVGGSIFGTQITRMATSPSQSFSRLFGVSVGEALYKALSSYSRKKLKSVSLMPQSPFSRSFERFYGRLKAEGKIGPAGFFKRPK